MNERERIAHEIATLASAQWLIKDRRTVDEAYRELQRAIDARASKLALMNDADASACEENLK